MEIGSARERILVALLIYALGEKAINTEIPITETEVDVYVDSYPISIKTVSGKNLGGIKLIWTVDPLKAKEFLENYQPKCDLLLVQINWNDFGCMYLIPIEVQSQVLKKLGRKNYIKLPKQGTNPRGVELSKEAMQNFIEHKDIKKIIIEFKRQNLDYDQFKRWINYWQN